MSFKKFEKKDILRNVIETHPQVRFDIYDSKFPLPPPGSLFGAGCCVGGRPGKPFSAPANWAAASLEMNMVTKASSLNPGLVSRPLGRQTNVPSGGMALLSTVSSLGMRNDSSRKPRALSESSPTWATFGLVNSCPATREMTQQARSLTGKSAICRFFYITFLPHFYIPYFRCSKSYGRWSRQRLILRQRQGPSCNGNSCGLVLGYKWMRKKLASSWALVCVTRKCCQKQIF